MVKKGPLLLPLKGKRGGVGWGYGWEGVGPNIPSDFQGVRTTSGEVCLHIKHVKQRTKKHVLYKMYADITRTDSPCFFFLSLSSLYTSLSFIGVF